MKERERWRKIMSDVPRELQRVIGIEEMEIETFLV